MANLKRIGLIMAAVLVVVVNASAAILSEDFNAAWKDQPVSGDNLPGSSWITNVSWDNGTKQTTYLGATAGTLTVDETSRASLQSAGSYVKPTKLHISGRFANNCPGTDNAWRGGFLGFSDVGTSGNVRGDFYGIVLRGVDGQVGLVNNSALAQTFPYSGTWDNTAYHTVSYTVDTVSGAISSVLIDAQTYSFTSAIFTNANTNYVTWYASSQSAGGYRTYMDWLKVEDGNTPVPEPATLALLGLGAMGLIVRSRR